MRRGAAVRWAVLALALAPVAAFGDNSPQVVLAQPGAGGNGGAIERYTIRFNQPMVPLGDPRSPAPFTTGCAGSGRWVDQQTWVFDFATPLRGETKCSFDAAKGLKSVAGYALNGRQSYAVDAGGPSARAVLPPGGGDEIEEDQVFLVATSTAPTRASVAANAYCAVDGLGEKIPVDVLAADLPAKLFGAMGTQDWSVRSFLENAGLPDAVPDAPAARQALYAGVTALKCRRALPPGRDVALVWPKGIASASGRLAGADQRFDYSVRKPFTARFECSRTNPQAGCSPVQPAYVRFTAPVTMSQAAAIRLTLADGRQIAPTFDDDDRKKATIADVTFKAPLPYDTAAKLTLPAGLKDESGRALTNGERFPLDVRFDAAPPLVKFAAGFGILEAAQGGVLPVTVRNVEPALQGRNLAIGGRTLKVGDSDAAVAAWLRTVAAADNYDVEEVKRGDEVVRRINHTGDRSILGQQGAGLKLGLPGKGHDFEVVGIPLGKPGFYVVELASPVLGRSLLGRNAPRYVASAALVTNMAVHFKWGRERSLVWVTALDTGQPVANASVAISDSCTGKLLARGATDRSGGLMIPAGLPQPETYDGCEDSSSAHALMVSARSDDDFSFALTSWGQGIRPSDFELPYGYSAPAETFHTVFDRALVRQGETIHMKHIVRRPNGSGFAIPAGFTGILRLSHRGSDTQFDVPLTIDARGQGETSWTAPQGAPMGDYDLRIVRGDEVTYTDQSFKVDEYKLPTMRASVTGPKAPAVRPRSLPLDLYVGYLSGGGAGSLPVEVRVGWFAHSGSPKGYDGYTFGGAKVEEGVRPMNGDGDDQPTPLPPTQTLPATLNAGGTARTSVDVPALDELTDMLVEMDYQDANGEVLTASRRLPIFPSAVQLGVKTDGWLMKQDDLRLRFAALDTAGKPIKGQKVSVALYSRQILTARRRLIGGFYAYDNQMRTTKLAADCTATTDAQGLGQCSVDPGVSGEVYVVATTTDADGNVSRAVRSVWLAGDDAWWFGGDNGDRMDVVPERTAYKAGETARFQVRMPFRSATALVTVEREGVLSSFVTELSGTDPVVEVPMPGSYAPDVYVSVMAVRGRIESGWTSWLRGIGQSLGLVKAEPAPEPTALVDLAKPAYRLGIAKVTVGWEGHTLAVDVKANRERFAPRGTAEVALQVRRPDGSPAASADVAFAAVDEALLQLAPNDSWDVLPAMMGDRPLSVLTATAQMQVVGKRHYGRKAVEAGGGGGDAAAALNRENFQPVLLWRGHVALDAQGRATLSVPLSDALSSFKLVGIATDGEGLFGTGTTTIRTAQDLSLYAGLPPLVRSGDWYAAGFTLRNGSDKPMTVTASVEVFPRIAQGRPLTVTLPAGGAVPVAWNLTAPQASGTLRWQVTARSQDGKAVDRLTATQEVVPAVPVETWAAALTRVADTSLPIAPPAGALPGRGSVDVQLTDTLAPPLAGVRRYMTDYPYNCFEQQLSRIVALGDTQRWAALAGAIPTYQASDGLLRYWPSETLDGSEALTAYVLSLTSEAGLPLPPAPRARMIEGLKAVLDDRVRRESYGDPRQQRLVAFAALARAGAATPAMLGQIGLPAQDMPTALLADYIAALDRVPLANAAALKAQAEGVLRSRLVYEGTRLDLSDAANAPWWLMSSGDEASVKTLLVSLGRPGWQDEAAKMMVGVALRQSRGHWDTTTANAWGAVAVRKFASLYPAQAIAGTTTMQLGGTSVSRAWPLGPEARTVSLPLPAAQTPLLLRQNGGAGPWAMVSVRAAVPLRAPLFAGYRASRSVTPVQVRTKGQLTRGDVLRVTITVDATAERNWVVVNDPIPAGATIIGDLANQSQMLGEGGGGEGVQPSYVERGNDSWRGFFAWVPRGRFTVSYAVRLNGAGRFSLPPTRVEAMYSPTVRAQLPNDPVVVAQR
ncbi:MG2 domain-containing protein [Sphingomonas sp. RP10(2022)]|uniref:MG2 domain-containing protein n=2 Tax=Sphingomonas liriopis TaxID=2949094 RepID=A0A9X2HRI7_9SPHN|nr:MG2 domain-containing protein [Sphingomonas liriopis]MCP3734144.1 MG2 domain-containing protein [Sphingomonas liriopis]